MKLQPGKVKPALMEFVKLQDFFLNNKKVFGRMVVTGLKSGVVAPPCGQCTIMVDCEILSQTGVNF